MEFEKIQVRVSSKLYKQLTALAKAEDRDLSTFVRRCVEDYLLQKELNGSEKQS